MRRVNDIDEDTDEEPNDSNEEQLEVLQMDGSKHKPFYMEGMMRGQYFKAIINTGSPFSIFTERDMMKIIGERKVVIKVMIEGERYVDYNR